MAASNPPLYLSHRSTITTLSPNSHISIKRFLTHIITKHPPNLRTRTFDSMHDSYLGREGDVIALVGYGGYPAVAAPWVGLIDSESRGRMVDGGRRRDAGRGG
jgi:hypothetical protein